MKISLIQKLEIFARGRYPNWINGGEFERLAMDEGKKASNASRRLREMYAAGILERHEEKSVSYRFIPPNLRTIEAKEKESPPPRESPKQAKKFWARVNQTTEPVKFVEAFKNKVETINQSKLL